MLKNLIFVTHDLEEAIYLSDKIVVTSMRRGRIQNVEEVALPRLRHNEMRLTDSFIQTKTRPWAMLDFGG